MARKAAAFFDIIRGRKQKTGHCRPEVRTLGGAREIARSCVKSVCHGKDRIGLLMDTAPWEVYCCDTAEQLIARRALCGDTPATRQAECIVDGATLFPALETLCEPSAIFAELVEPRGEAVDPGN